jgi:hypothetical protein
MTAIYIIRIKCDGCGMIMEESAPWPINHTAINYREILKIGDWTKTKCQALIRIKDYCPTCSKENKKKQPDLFKAKE